jgi:repressor LexA
MQLRYTVLTENQKKVLEAIISYIRVNNIAPTTREIQNLSGLSPRGVTLQLQVLEKQGFITRKLGARGIEVTQSLLHVQKDEKIKVSVTQADEGIISIPMMTASIPAGPVSFVEEHTDNQIDIPLSVTRGMRNVFAVKVSGDSMIGAGIESGDIAIIATQPIANEGDIVAALHDGGVTLKKFRIVDGRPILMPANPKYEPITKEFSIQGKLINVIKLDEESLT